jgi:hypothetical protein
MSVRVASDCDPDGIKNAAGESPELSTPSVSCNSNCNGISSWRRRAEELADWTQRRMVNRRDVSGAYYLDENDRVKVTTSRVFLTRNRIIRHFRAKSIADVLGLHTTARVILEQGAQPCLSLWLAVDIDQHGDGDFSHANLQAALGWRDVLISLGFHPLLTDSNGKGGFHLRVFLQGPTLTLHVRQLGRWLVRDWQERGLNAQPEVFPKPAEIALAGPGSCGNWLRLPGRHPKRDHWSAVLDGPDWLRGDEAIDFILNLTGDPSQLIPNEAITFEPDVGRQISRRSSEPKTADDMEYARQALEYLGNGVKDERGREFLTDYDLWLTIGMALHELGDRGLELWEKWSKQEKGKHEKTGRNSCAAKWATFNASDGHGVTIATLFHHAKANGWPGEPTGRTVEWTAQGAYGVNEASDDPHRLARLHLGKFRHEGGPMLRFFRGEWLGWSNGAYRSLGDSELRAGLTGTIKQEFNRLNQIAVKLWETSVAEAESSN